MEKKTENNVKRSRPKHKKRGRASIADNGVREEEGDILSPSRAGNYVMPRLLSP